MLLTHSGNCQPCRSKCGWQRRIKRGVHTLRQPEFQVLHVEDGVADGAEKEALKRLVTSERFV